MTKRRSLPDTRVLQRALALRMTIDQHDRVVSPERKEPIKLPVQVEPPKAPAPVEKKAPPKPAPPKPAPKPVVTKRFSLPGKLPPQRERKPVKLTELKEFKEYTLETSTTKTVVQQIGYSDEHVSGILRLVPPPTKDYTRSGPVPTHVYVVVAGTIIEIESVHHET